MPTLEWVGKAAVLNHHREVPYRLLKNDERLSAGDPGIGNLLVQGDNLEALKALLPYYAGRVKCIYIDPPYNTGNEGWTYNDAVNSPEIRAWLGKTVGKEAEDLSRHDKWLCMMYPRLHLLREFLREDGAIFISIDDNELPTLRLVMDEVFGGRNFIACIIWQKIFSPKNSARHFSEDHDYIAVYARNSEVWTPNLIQRGDLAKSRYANPDNDPRGPWTSGDLQARNYYSEGTYSITCPSGRVIEGPGKGMYWRFSKENFLELDRDGRIWWGKTGNNMPRLKRFLSEVKQGVVPQTLWTYQEVGHTQEAKKELLEILDFPDSQSVFITPKPTRLIKRILQISTDKDSLILDSFAGSGTTGHAVLSLNREDGGHRRFILVEMDEKICQTITAERLRRVINGYKHVNAKGVETAVEGLGGGFRYCTLGSSLFDERGDISKEVRFEDLARHIFFTETGEPMPAEVRGKPSPLLGVSNGVACYLLYNGVLGDRKPDGGNILTTRTLKELPPHGGLRVVYGEGCLLSAARLKQERISFKQIPYQIKTS